MQASRKPEAACECSSIASNGIMNPVIQQSRLVLVHTQDRAELGSKAGINLEQCLSFEILTILVLSNLQFFSRVKFLWDNLTHVAVRKHLSVC